jgi:multiple sugar transport system substrate-binding protein
MRNLKVLTLVILSLVLVLGLAACSSGNDTSNNNTSTTNNTANNTKDEPAAEVVTKPVVEETPATDLGGRTIKIAAWWDDTPVGDTAGGMARLDKIAELEEKYNMKVEFINIPFEEYMDKFTTTVLAGEPFADVAIMEYKRAIVPVKDGLVLPLSEFTLGNSNVNNEQNLIMKLPPLGGGEYAFNKVGVSVVGLHYNRDLFTKLGLPDLQEIYAKGEWTWDKFLEVARLATRDTDNDGKTDSFGFSGWPADTARHFGATNDAKFVDDATFVEGISDPKMIQTLEFVSSLSNVEKVVKVKGGNKMDWNETNTFKDGDVAMAIMYDWNLGDLPFEVGVVPIPKGPSGSGKWTYANTALNGWFIPKGVKDPQIIFQIFEEMQDVPPTEEYIGQDWLESRYTREADIKMALDNINGTGMVSVEEGIPDFPFYGMMDEIIIENLSVAATVEARKGEGQAALDKLK